MREKPFNSIDGSRRVSQQCTEVKEGAAVVCTSHVDVDAAFEGQFGQSNSNFSELRIGQIGWRRAKSDFWLGNISTRLRKKSEPDPGQVRCVQGFPTMTVPAGFTTVVYDRVLDPSSADGTRVASVTQAKLPAGIDFAGRPFDEPTLLKIASAYERATKHRTPPPDFGPLPNHP